METACKNEPRAHKGSWQEGGMMDIMSISHLGSDANVSGTDVDIFELCLTFCKVIF